MRHEAQDMRYLPIFILFEFISTPLSTPYSSSSDRWVTSYLQVKEATWGTHQYLNGMSFSALVKYQYGILDLVLGPRLISTVYIFWKNGIWHSLEFVIFLIFQDSIDYFNLEFDSLKVPQILLFTTFFALNMQSLHPVCEKSLSRVQYRGLSVLFYLGAVHKLCNTILAYFLTPSPSPLPPIT